MISRSRVQGVPVYYNLDALEEILRASNDARYRVRHFIKLSDIVSRCIYMGVIRSSRVLQGHDEI